MTEKQIFDDRNSRIDACKKEIEASLIKYQFNLIAEDNWTPNTKVKVEVSFVDLKKYNAAVAEKDNPTVQMGQSSTPHVPTESVVDPIAPTISPETSK